MDKSEVFDNNGYPLYYLAIAVLVLAILVAFIGKTYAENHSDIQIADSTSDIALSETAKLDCISQGHLESLEEIRSKTYSVDVESYRIPSVSLVDQHGEAIELGNLLDGDQPVLLNFIYTTCTTVCPVLTSTFTKAQDFSDSELDGVRLVSVTIDPENDSPSVLGRYANRFHADSDRLFLTGGIEEILKVQNSFDAYRGEKMNHIPLTFIKAANSGQWVRLEGFPSVEEIIQEYKTAEQSIEKA